MKTLGQREGRLPRAVVAQRLVRVLCSWCRRPRDLDDAERRWLDSVGLDPGVMPTFVADGCSQCRNLGYHGRTGVFEVWRLTDTDYQVILRHEDERAIRALPEARKVRWSLDVDPADLY